jgi:lipopolysaccharide export system permease protein
MRKIDRMTLRAFIPPFLMSVTIIIFILVLQFISLYLNEIQNKGLSPEILGKLFFYAAGKVLITAMPVGVLTAGLMTFGNMGEHNELMALKSSGVNLFKIMRAVVFLVIFVTAGSIYLAFEVIPKANLKFFSLLYDVQRKKANLALQPGHFYSDIENYVIRISDKNVEREILYDVLIYNHSENRGNNDIIQADSARMDLFGNVMRMTLYHGMRYEEYKPNDRRKKRYKHGRTSFDSLYYRFELKGFELDRTDETQFRHQIIMPRRQLVGALDSLQDLRGKNLTKAEDQLSRYNKVSPAYSLPDGEGREPPTEDVQAQVFHSLAMAEGDSILGCLPYEQRIDVVNRALTNARAVKSYAEFMQRKHDDLTEAQRKYRYEYYLRWAMPLSCLVFAMLGIPLGAIIRKGGLGLPGLVSIGMFFLYYVMLTWGKKSAHEGLWPAELGAFLPVIVFLPIAAYVTHQAATDSGLLREEFRPRTPDDRWADLLAYSLAVREKLDDQAHRSHSHSPPTDP